MATNPLFRLIQQGNAFKRLQKLGPGRVDPVGISTTDLALAAIRNQASKGFNAAKLTEFADKFTTAQESEAKSGAKLISSKVPYLQWVALADTAGGAVKRWDLGNQQGIKDVPVLRDIGELITGAGQEVTNVTQPLFSGLGQALGIGSEEYPEAYKVARRQEAAAELVNSGKISSYEGRLGFWDSYQKALNESQDAYMTRLAEAGETKNLRPGDKPETENPLYRDVVSDPERYLRPLFAQQERQQDIQARVQQQAQAIGAREAQRRSL